MTGKRTFFSLHYQRDVWRASNIRHAGQFDARAAAGWNDASLWEATKKRGCDAVKQLIDGGLKNTAVTAVLIGAETSKRTRLGSFSAQRVEGLAEVVGDGVGGGEDVVAGLDFDGAVSAGGSDEFADGPAGLVLDPAADG
jgi:hypothetical protein